MFKIVLLFLLLILPCSLKAQYSIASTYSQSSSVSVIYAFPTTNFTFNCWARFFDQTAGTIISTFDQIANTNGFQIAIGGGGLTVGLRNNNYNDLACSENFPAGWNMITVTVSNSAGCSVFVDASTVGYSATSTAIGSSGVNPFFLNNATGGNPCDGDLDGPAIWTRVLSQAEINTLYASGVGVYLSTSTAPYNSGLAFGSNCDEDTGTTSADVSGNSRTMTDIVAWAPSTVCLSAFTPTNTPTMTPTATPTPSGNSLMLLGVGSISWVPTATQTPTSPTNTVYASLGDSWTVGFDTPPGHGFTYYVGQQLNIWYPTTEYPYTNFGIGGTTSADLVVSAPISLATIAGLGYGPMARATIEIGGNNIAQPYGFVDSFGVTCFSCCNGASDANSITYSYQYKTELEEVCADIYSVNSSAKIVITTPADPSNNGIGPGVPYGDQAQFQAYGSRVKEVATYETGLGYSCQAYDMYADLMGCTTCYNTTIPDPNHPSPYGYQRIGNGIIPYFANGG